MKTYLCFCLMAISLLTYANEATNLNVWAKDGSKVTYALNEKPRISFTEDGVTIQTESYVFNHPLDQFKCITYAVDQLNGISTPGNDRVEPFIIEGDAIVFSSVNESFDIAIYTVDGKSVHHSRIQKGESTTITLKDYKTGMYIISANGLTYKFVKR